MKKSLNLNLNHETDMKLHPTYIYPLFIMWKRAVGGKKKVTSNGSMLLKHDRENISGRC